MVLPYVILCQLIASRVCYRQPRLLHFYALGYLDMAGAYPKYTFTYIGKI